MVEDRMKQCTLYTKRVNGQKPAVGGKEASGFGS